MILYVLLLVTCFFNEIMPAKYRGNGYKYDPYTTFGKPTNILTATDFADNPMDVVDVYYNKAHQPEDKSLFVVGSTEEEGPVIVKYNSDGQVINKQGFCGYYTLSSRGRVLWKDNFFYIPIFGEGGEANIFKLQYNDDISSDNNFQTFGRLDVSIADRNCILTSVVEFNNFFYAGGMSYIDGNNKFLVVKFDDDAAHNVIYTEDVGANDSDRCLTQMVFYEINNFVYVLTIDSNDRLWLLKLTDDGNEHVITPEELTDSSDSISDFHGICLCEGGFFATFLDDNENPSIASLGFVTDGNAVSIQGNAAVLIDISEIPHIITNSVRFPYLTMLGDQLFLGGSYKTTRSGNQRYPLVACYNIENPTAPVLDDTFFNVGYWYYQPAALASEALASPFTFTQIIPSLSLVSARGSKLIHIYPDFFKDLQMNIGIRVIEQTDKGNYIPFMPHK